MLRSARLPVRTGGSSLELVATCAPEAVSGWVGGGLTAVCCGAPPARDMVALRGCVWVSMPLAMSASVSLVPWRGLGPRGPAVWQRFLGAPPWGSGAR